MPRIDPLAPACDWMLSDEGRTGALRLAERLEAHLPGAIASSVEPKARDTAEIVGDYLNCPVKVESGLHEHDRRNVGVLDQAAFQAAVSELFDRPSELVFGRETANAAHERFHAAVRAVASKYEPETVAIVTHGTVMTLFLSRLLEVEPFPMWRRLGLPSFAVVSWPTLEFLELVTDVG